MEVDKNNRATIPKVLLTLCNIKPKTRYLVYLDFKKKRIGFIQPSEPTLDKCIIGECSTDERTRFSPGTFMKSMCASDNMKEYYSHWTFNVQNGELFLSYIDWN